MATYYVDYLLGSDTARTTLTGCIASNPSSTTVLITKVAHGLFTGAKVSLTLFTNWLNTYWIITKVNDDSFTLDSAVWQATADTNGSCLPFGGSSFGDSWKTVAGGSLSGVRLVAGDILRYAKSPDPISMGQTALWTSANSVGGVPAYVTCGTSDFATPITITKTAHGYLTDDIVHIYGHPTNTSANGVWKIVKTSDNTFTLTGSIGIAAGAASGNLAKITNKCVQLTNAVTADVCNCDNAWTAGTNVTSAGLDGLFIIFKTGRDCIKIVTATMGANQIVAKFGLPVSLNLESYEQLSFWFRNETTALAAGDLVMKLYSDAACTSEVESLAFPAMQGTARWAPIVLNKASVLSNTVQGIAVYSTISLATKTFYIDNIVACKSTATANGLTHQTLISKNMSGQQGDDVFVCIQGIYNNIITLDADTNTNSREGRGYYGKTENVTLWKRETIKTTMGTLSYAPFIIQVSKTGTALAHIKHYGGIDIVSNTKTGRTVFDGQNGFGICISGNGISYNDFDGFQSVRHCYGINEYSAQAEITDCHMTNQTYGGFYSSSTGFSLMTNCHARANRGYGFYMGFICSNFSGNVARDNQGYGFQNLALWDITDGYFDNNLIGLQTNNAASKYLEITSCCYNGTGVYINSGGSGQIELLKLCNFNTVGIYLGTIYYKIITISDLSDNITALSFYSTNDNVREITACNRNTVVANYSSGTFNNTIYKIGSGSGNGQLVTSTSVGSGNHIMNAALTGYISAQPVQSYHITFYLTNCTGLNTYNGISYAGTYRNDKIFSTHQNTRGNHVIHYDSGMVTSESTERYTASGISWKMSPTHIRRNVYFPLDLSLAKVLCLAGKLVTVSVWVKKTHLTDIGARLVVIGNKIIGIGSTTTDVYAEAISSTDWQQLTISFTPTYDEVVEIEAWAFWVANTADESVYVDDITIIATP